MEAYAEVLENKFFVKEWRHGDPYPVFNSSVGIDTETTLIDDIESIPELAYAGFYIPETNTCYITNHTDATELLEYCSRTDCVQYYFNAAFDFLVLDKASQTRMDSFWFAAESRRIIDVGCRAQLYNIATDGYIKASSYSLKGMCKEYLQYDMDKGEADGEAAARLTFRPGVPLTEAQLVYLGIDCYTTWCLGNIIPRMATEDIHTRGSIVLRSIEVNGLSVDKRIWDAFVAMLTEDKEKYRQELLCFGFPDPCKERIPEYDYSEDTCNLLTEIMSNAPADIRCTINKAPSKDQIRRILVYLHGCPDKLPEVVATIMQDAKKKPYKKESDKLDQIIDEFSLGAIFSCRNLQALNAVFYTLISGVWRDHTTFAEAMETADDLLQCNPQWLAPPPVQQIGPKAFMQQHLEGMMKKYPKLKLARTKKSKELKLSKDDLWQLELMGINDPFLTSHQNYSHANKFLNTYLNDKYIRRDGKIHPRFTNIVRTGRTSCAEPNLQNLPSRGSIPLKNIFRASDDGMILCATDFSFIELVCFAQACYTRFGVSVMRDVINAGVDPHRWFAGVMHDLISASTEELADAAYVEELNAKLEREVNKQWRQDAKAAKPKLALHRVTYVEEESELLGKVQPTQSAAKHTDGQNARCMKVQRPSRQGVGHMPEALLLRNK